MVLAKIKHLDWEGWLYGLLHAAVGGGAASASTGISGSVIDPANLAFGTMNSLKLMGVSFIVSAVISILMYLKQSPLPPPVVDDSEHT